MVSMFLSTKTFYAFSFPSPPPISLYLNDVPPYPSRVERVGCCLCFLTLAMITSAMFYQGANNLDRKQPEADLELGPFRLGYQQVSTVIVCLYLELGPFRLGYQQVSTVIVCLYLELGPFRLGYQQVSTVIVPKG